MSKASKMRRSRLLMLVPLMAVGLSGCGYTSNLWSRMAGGPVVPQAASNVSFEQIEEAVVQAPPPPIEGVGVTAPNAVAGFQQVAPQFQFGGAQVPQQSAVQTNMWAGSPQTVVGGLASPYVIQGSMAQPSIYQMPQVLTQSVQASPIQSQFVQVPQMTDQVVAQPQGGLELQTSVQSTRQMSDLCPVSETLVRDTQTALTPLRNVVSSTTDGFGVHFSIDVISLPEGRGLANADLIMPALTHLIDQYELLFVQVLGHTADKGDDEFERLYTDILAKRIAQQLTNHGISADRIQSRGYGSQVKGNAGEKAERVGLRLALAENCRSNAGLIALQQSLLSQQQVTSVQAGSQATVSSVQLVPAQAQVIQQQALQPQMQAVQSLPQAQVMQYEVAQPSAMFRSGFVQALPLQQYYVPQQLAPQSATPLMTSGVQLIPQTQVIPQTQGAVLAPVGQMLQSYGNAGT